MGRGKIEIRWIENPTNRQVTYSKRRQGIIRKATELTVLCDAQVSIIMFSSSGKHADYCSPNTDIKKLIDRYQEATGIDLWSSQYEKMQANLKHLKEINGKLRKEIRQRIGKDLEGLSLHDLLELQKHLDESVRLVRGRKYHVISTQTETFKKKVKNSHEVYKTIVRELKRRDEHPVLYDFVEEDPNAYVNGSLALSNRGSDISNARYRVQPSQPNLHRMGFGDLRLA